jgi:hypothetical protein
VGNNSIMENLTHTKKPADLTAGVQVYEGDNRDGVYNSDVRLRVTIFPSPVAT